METKQKRNILIAATVLLLVAVTILLLPTAVEALPPDVRYRLPDAISQIGVTPVADDPLPAPSADTQADLSAAPALPGIDEAALQPTATNTPEPTATPVAVEVVEESAEPTATPLPPTETPTPAPTATPEPLPLTVLLEGLTNVPQTFNNCGPANLSIVLDYHGDETTQTDAAAYLKPNPNDRNVSPWQISDYVNEFTALSSTVHSGGEMEMLKRLIAAGYAPVIERGADFDDGQGWYGHYLTLFGYDDEKETFMAMDTYAVPWAPNGSEFTYEDIWDSWRAFNYTFYVVYPPEEEQVVFDIVGEELLDEQRMWQKTIEVANRDIAANPEDPFAWFNLGTAYTELGRLNGQQVDYQQGAAAFDQARTIGLPQRMLWYQFRPYLAYYKVGRMQDVIDLAEATAESSGGQNVEETYYWLGNALTLNGNVSGAIEAYEQALKINENFYYAQWAIDSLN
ncbi:MAG: C39 family peptidase [Anaerolineae bacterium]|nr:C39 family peptidase [Anaerolineae bacterium]MCO5205998.1 C39 family peptidase [Anaerolineae bacterium]